MGIPTVECCICKQVVNKRSTKAVGDNKRACRSHDETENLSQKVQETLAQKHKKTLDNLKKQRERWRYNHELPKLSGPCCFACNRAGLRADVWLEKMMVLGEKYELVYGQPLNPFLPEECAKAYEPLKGVACIFIVSYDPKVRMPLVARSAAQMAGVMGLCAECCSKNGIKPFKKLEMDLETLHVIGSAVKPILKDMAKRELEESN